MRKLKTPEQIAAESRRGKKRFSLYLSMDAMEYISQRATKAKVKPSRIVDEAIQFYIEAVAEKKHSK